MNTKLKLGFNRGINTGLMAVIANQASVNQTLPQYLATTPLTLLEGFESTTGWSLVVGDSVAVNSSEKVQGTNSLKVVRAGDGATLQIEKNPNASFAAYKNMIVYCYPHSAGYDNTAPNVVYLASQADYSKVFSLGNLSGGTGFYVHAGQWNALDLSQHRWSNTGSEAWTNTMVKFKVRAAGLTGGAQISWDNFIGYTGKPVIMISFDDCYESVYSKAFAYMNPRHIKGTMYTNTNIVDGAGNLTVANLTEMYAAGWDIANHGAAHINFLASTQAQIESDIGTAITALDGWGFTRSSHHLAYPYGSINNPFDADVRAALTSQGILTGRMVSNFDFLLPGLQLWDIPAFDIPNATTLATVQGWVDTAKANNKVLSLYFHNIVDVPTVDTQWSTAKFNALIDYIVAQQIQTVTIDELYRLQSGAVTVRMPWA